MSGDRRSAEIAKVQRELAGVAVRVDEMWRDMENSEPKCTCPGNENGPPFKMIVTCDVHGMVARSLVQEKREKVDAELIVVAKDLSERSRLTRLAFMSGLGLGMMLGLMSAGLVLMLVELVKAGSR